MDHRTRGSAELTDRLRHLAETDAGIAGLTAGASRGVDHHGMDGRTAALIGLGALVALRAAPASYRGGVDLALAAGASVDDVVETLRVVARTVGLARVVSAAPDLAQALGYDIDRALETLDNPRGDPADALRAGQYTELVAARDRLAAGGHAELPVDGDRLRLHRVPGDVQSLADLPEREVGGEQREEP